MPKDEMFVSFRELADAVYQRVKKEEYQRADFNRFCECMLSIMIDRFFKNIPTVIDNFGMLSRKRGKERTLFNVVKREFMRTRTDMVILLPSRMFVSYLQEPGNMRALRKMIIEKSKKVPLTGRGRIRRV